MENNPPAHDFKEFTLKINEVLQGYLAVVDSVAREPYVRSNIFFFQAFKTPASFLRPFKEGELSPLSLIVVRYIQNLFVSYHIKSRTQKISDYLQYEELKTVLTSPEDKGRIDTIKNINESLSKLESMLSRGVRLKILLVISPVIPFLSWALDFFSIKPNLSVLNSLNLPSHRQSLIIWGGVTLLYLLAIIASSFIAKRQVMSDKNIYLLEQQLFKTMNRGRPHEKPIDIIGWTLTIVLYSLLYASLFNRFFTSNLWNSIAIGIIVYSMIFVYVFIKRVKLDKW